MITIYTVAGTTVEDHHLKIDERPDGEGWPEDELHNGVGDLHVSLSGDAPAIPFVRVSGVDLEACQGVYERIMANLPTATWWGQPAGEWVGDDE